MFFYNRIRIREKHFLSYKGYMSSTITRSCEARPMGKKGNQVSLIFVWCAIFEAVGADVFLWLLLAIGRNKMALAGHPRPWETRLSPQDKRSL